MASSSTQPEAGSSNPFVVSSGPTSGLDISLHPLAILNISEHHTRSRLTDGVIPIGALLGSQAGRDVSIANSFELALVPDGDIAGRKVDAEFLETRREQFSQVFPTLSVVGWYSVGAEPSAEDAAVHEQFTATLETATAPLFLLFHPSIPRGAQNLPISIYEAAPEHADGAGATKFVALKYGIETGEAERIAVDGVARGDGGDNGLVGTLTAQRNAIKMLYDRVSVLAQYVGAVLEKKAQPDHAVLRQISALVATLPVMDAEGFRTELDTDIDDFELQAHLTAMLKQLNSLVDYSDKHAALFQQQTDEREMRSGGLRTMGFGRGGGGGRRGRGREPLMWEA
ncbi:hypothetical protein Q5752_004103 [Cryptotrichosporon argae]